MCDESFRSAFLSKALVSGTSVNENLNLCIFPIDYPLASPSPSWPDMELAISQTLFLHPLPYDVRKVIETLKAKINAGGIGRGDKRNILKTFQNIINPFLLDPIVDLSWSHMVGTSV